MRKSKLHCPACESDRLGTVGEARSVRAPDGTDLTYSEEYTRCENCGEEFLTREQSLASSRARTGELRAYEGLLTPDEIRSIRESYGLTQAALEKALGVGPKTVVRWEKGTVCQSRAVNNLLRLAREYPSAFRAVAEWNGVAIDALGAAYQPAAGIDVSAMQIGDSDLAALDSLVCVVDSANQSAEEGWLPSVTAHAGQLEAHYRVVGALDQWPYAARSVAYIPAVAPIPEATPSSVGKKGPKQQKRPCWMSVDALVA